MAFMTTPIALPEPSTALLFMDTELPAIKAAERLTTGFARTHGRISGVTKDFSNCFEDKTFAD